MSRLIQRCQWIGCLVIIAASLSCRAAEPKTNIVLINVDDWGWTDAGFLGSEFYETPNIDSLVSRGMVFRNAYAAAANCAPSRASLMSGQYSPRHGIYTVGNSDRGKTQHRRLISVRNETVLAAEFVTIAESLQSAGYMTVTIGKWHLGDDPCDQGFDVNIAGSRAGHPRSYFSPYRNPHLPDGAKGEYLTDRLTTEAIRIIEQPRTKPLFLYFPYFTVHTPLQGKPELVNKYKEKKATSRHSNSKYAAMIESLDQNIGRLITTLRNRGMEQNTLLILTSDNGGIRAVSSTSPLRAGKGSYYEGGIKVPLAVVWPGVVKPQSSSDELVSNLDFYPTFLQVAGVAASGAALDGQSLMPLFHGRGEFAERDLFWHFPIYLQAYNQRLDDSRDPLFRTRPGSVIRSGNWKLHEYFEDNAVELYDLSKDPGERVNLATTNASKAAELHARLRQWRKRLAAPVPTEPNPSFGRN